MLHFAPPVISPAWQWYGCHLHLIEWEHGASLVIAPYNCGQFMACITKFMMKLFVIFVGSGSWKKQAARNLQKITAIIQKTAQDTRTIELHPRSLPGAAFERALKQTVCSGICSNTLRSVHSAGTPCVYSLPQRAPSCCEHPSICESFAPLQTSAHLCLKQRIPPSRHRALLCLLRFGAPQSVVLLPCLSTDDTGHRAIGRRGHIDLVPNLIWYKCSAAT